MVSGTASTSTEGFFTSSQDPLQYDLSRLHIAETGPPEGDPILLLHGWGSSARLMQPIVDGLSDVYRVVNVDLPGHGQSPAPPVAWGVPEYARLVAEIIRSRSLVPVTIIGHSNGGRISLFMASEPAYAALIRRLVLVSPSGITPLRSWKYYVRRFLAKLLKAPFVILPEPMRSYCLDWLRHTLLWKAISSSDYQQTQGVMRETFVKTVSFHVDERIGRIRVPTLLFWGDKDTDISHYQMQVLEKGIPDAGLVVLKNAGHYGYLDDIDTFTAGVRYFLEHA